MRHVNRDELEQALHAVGMQMGEWNRVVDPERQQGKNDYAASFYSVEMTTLAQDMHQLAAYVAAWLPAGRWKLLHLIYGCASEYERFLLGRMLGISCLELNIPESFIFEYGISPDIDHENDLVIINIIFFLMLFENHAFFVSSGSGDGEILSIEDGVVAFKSRKPDISGAQKLLDKYHEEVKTEHARRGIP